MEKKELDLLGIILKLRRSWKIILSITLFSLLIGIGIVFFVPNQYKAKCTLGLETEDRVMRISIDGESPLQSMNLGGIGSARIISPSNYPDILFSVPFQKELIYKYIYFSENDSITFHDYFLKDKSLKNNHDETYNVNKLTFGEQKCLSFLKNRLRIEVNSDRGYLKLSIVMQNPLVAAQLLQYAQNMLQDYIIKFRIAKAQTALDFIEGRYKDIKKELKNKQQLLTEFYEENRNKNNAEIKNKEAFLINDYELFFDLYSDVVKQLEKAKIQIKEDMPVLTLIEPVTLPSSPSNFEWYIIIAISLLIGLFLGCTIGIILILINDRNSKI